MCERQEIGLQLPYPHRRLNVGAGRRPIGARQWIGRNQATGAEIQIPAAMTLKFTAGKALKDAVNGA